MPKRKTNTPKRTVPSRPAKSKAREDRIVMEIIVDAYGPEEQAMGWYYYLEDKLSFPFRAKCVAERVISPLRKGDTVEVTGNTKCSSPFSGRVGLSGSRCHSLRAPQLSQTRSKPLKIGITGFNRGMS